MTKGITLTLDDIEDIVIAHVAAKGYVSTPTVAIQWELKGKNTTLTISDENNNHIKE